MTLRLFLMRHGKSDWSFSADDHARPLNERGVAASQGMGKLLSQSGQLPDQILSSTATRALMTAELFCFGADLSLKIQTTDSLYESEVKRVLKSIRQVESGESLLVVGHQPVWSELASDLIGGGALRFPTAAIARVDFDCQRWSQVEIGQGVLKWLLQPKLFRHNGTTY